MEGLLGYNWWMWGGLCSGMALFYLFLYPKPRWNGGSEQWKNFRNFIFRWGRFLVWFLMALACFVNLVPRLIGTHLSLSLAITAVFVFFAFFVALGIDRTKAGR